MVNIVERDMLYILVIESPHYLVVVLLANFLGQIWENSIAEPFDSRCGDSDAVLRFQKLDGLVNIVIFSD